MKLTREEFEKLAMEHLDMLYRIARRMCGNATLADDLVQDTYLRAFRASGDFTLQEFGIRPWLIRIMHNVYVTRSQREQRQPAAIDDVQLDGLGHHSAASETSNAANFDGMDEHLVHAIEDLPEEYRAVLMLWAVEDFSYKEIADALDVPIGTVMSRLHRTRAKLADRLHDYAVKERIIKE